MLRDEQLLEVDLRVEPVQVDDRRHLRQIGVPTPLPEVPALPSGGDVGLVDSVLGDPQRIVAEPVVHLLVPEGRPGVDDRLRPDPCSTTRMNASSLSARSSGGRAPLCLNGVSTSTTGARSPGSNRTRDRKIRAWASRVVVRHEEVVGAAAKSRLAHPLPMRDEERVEEVDAGRRQGQAEVVTALGRGLPVDPTAVVRDVEALDRRSLGGKRRQGRTGDLPARARPGHGDVATDHGAVAELAQLVRSPADDRAVLTLRAGVVAGDVEPDDPLLEPLDGGRRRRRAVGSRRPVVDPLPELAELVRAPALDRPGLEQRTGERKSDVDRAGRPGQPDDPDRPRAGLAGSVAELTEAVLTPAGDPAVAQERAGVVPAGVDLPGGGRQALDRDRGRRVQALVLAELSRRAVAPAGDRAVRQEGAGMKPSRRDLDGRTGQPLDRRRRRVPEPHVRAGRGRRPPSRARGRPRRSRRCGASRRRSTGAGEPPPGRRASTGRGAHGTARPRSPARPPSAPPRRRPSRPDGGRGPTGSRGAGRRSGRGRHARPPARPEAGTARRRRRQATHR